MSLQEIEQPPPYTEEHEPLKLPAVARDVPIHGGKIPTLEPLPSLLSSPPQHPLDPSPEQIGARRGSNALQTAPGTVVQPIHLPSVPSNDLLSLPKLVETTRAMSVDSRRGDKNVSAEDADDRMAAEALCGLGKIESTRSNRTPSGYDQPLKYYPMNIEHTRSANANGEPEPLLSLLTSSHPWLGGTINGSISAYSATKSNSPRFVQYSADFVERKIGSTMANTVGSVGRKTGVEEGLRRYLARRAEDVDHIDPEILGEENSSKRRRISNEDEESGAEGPSLRRTLSGHTSIETLPLYDDNRSPAYEDSEASRSTPSQQAQVSRSWSTQLMISTSGLGAALNDASLRSLKYVLNILRTANSRVRRLMEALKKILEDHSSARNPSPEAKLEEGATVPEKDANHDPQPHSNGTTFAERVNHLNNEIWKTLKSVVNTVSRYTGGALPENASVIVRWQLMSVPRRWQRAREVAATENLDSDGNIPAKNDTEALSSANRMLAFAVEGIDMMEQVGGVIDSTILSAEKWLDSMGRKRKKSHVQAKSEHKRDGSEDVKMSNEDERNEDVAPTTELPATATAAGGDDMLIDTST